MDESIEIKIEPDVAFFESDDDDYQADYESTGNSISYDGMQKCVYCDEMCTEEYMLIHLATHPEQEIFKCDWKDEGDDSDCGDYFILAEDLENHKKMHLAWTNVSDESGNVNSQLLSVLLDEFVCTQCGQSFPREDLLQRHEKSHLDEVQCEICDKTISKRSLSKHILIHSGFKPFTCVECGKAFGRRDHLRKHEKTHSSLIDKFPKNELESSTTDGLEQHLPSNPVDRPFVCEECGKAFARRDYLRKHEKTHPKIQSAIEKIALTCKACSEEFPTKEDFKEHINLVHSNEKPFSCAECGKAFGRRDHLRKHERTHLKGKCQKNEFTKTEVSEPELHLDDKPFNCQECGKTFAKRDYLRKHEKTHPNIKYAIEKSSLTCKTCLEEFPTKEELKEHNKLLHSNEKRFSCAECGKAFSRRNRLNRHERTHLKQTFVNGKHDTKCKFCSTECLTKVDLNEHYKQIHSSEMPFGCEKCGKVFGRRDHLQRHEETHLRQHFLFNQETDHPQHQQVKKPTCNICSKELSSQSALKKHLLTHAAVKKFTCSECGKLFSKWKLLQKHKKVHQKHIIKVKPKCEVCLKQFSKPSHVKRHMLIHEREKLKQVSLSGEVHL